MTWGCAGGRPNTTNAATLAKVTAAAMKAYAAGDVAALRDELRFKRGVDVGREGLGAGSRRERVGAGGRPSGFQRGGSEAVGVEAVGLAVRGRGALGWPRRDRSAGLRRRARRREARTDHRRRAARPRRGPRRGARVPQSGRRAAPPRAAPEGAATAPPQRPGRRRRSRSLSGRLAHPFVHEGQDTGAQRGAIAWCRRRRPSAPGRPRPGPGTPGAPAGRRRDRGAPAGRGAAGPDGAWATSTGTSTRMERSGANPAVAQSTSRASSAVSSPRP